MSLITSLHQDEWDLMNRGTDDLGRPMCHVRHKKASGQVVVHRLIFRPTRGNPQGLWHKIGFLSGSKGRLMRVPEPHGKALSGSRIDLTLRSLAEFGHANAYV